MQDRVNVFSDISDENLEANRQKRSCNCIRHNQRRPKNSENKEKSMKVQQFALRRHSPFHT